jgi:hypothetical protein
MGGDPRDARCGLSDGDGWSGWVENGGADQWRGGVVCFFCEEVGCEERLIGGVGWILASWVCAGCCPGRNKLAWKARKIRTGPTSF